MDKITTATGKQFDTDYFVPAGDGQISLRVLNADIATVSSVFFNRNETIQLWCEGEYYSQYTKPVVLIPENGAYKIILAKEV